METVTNPSLRLSEGSMAPKVDLPVEGWYRGVDLEQVLEIGHVGVTPAHILRVMLCWRQLLMCEFRCQLGQKCLILKSQIEVGHCATATSRGLNGTA